MKKLISLFLLAFALLSACQPRSFNPNLSPEEAKAIGQDIAELKEALKTEKNPDGSPSHLRLIEMARDYEKLGDINSAIKLYEDYLNDGWRTKAVRNNLGRLYEHQEKYDLAVKQYQTIVDEYNDQEYLYDITWAYIRAENRTEAEKAFNAWQLAFKKTDLQTQQAIQKLRDQQNSQ